MNFNALFNTLVEKRELSIKNLSPEAYESLRVRLVKAFSKHKKFLDETGLDDGDCALSISGEYSKASSTASFYIRERKQKTTVDFEVVENLSGADENPQSA